MKTPKTRAEMIAYLSEHFRYDTMHSWNRATSYAVNVKFHKLTFPDAATRERAYGLLETNEALWEAHDIIREFDKRHNYAWQIGFNGRSGGYMVLYQGGVKPDEHKSRCAECGQRNYLADAKKCGVCGSTDMRPYSGQHTFTYPGKGLDMDEYFSEWDTESLRSRVALVLDFDRTCAACVKAFIDFCATHKPEVKTIRVPKQIMVAVET